MSWLGEAEFNPWGSETAPPPADSKDDDDGRKNEEVYENDSNAREELKAPVESAEYWRSEFPADTPADTLHEKTLEQFQESRISDRNDRYEFEPFSEPERLAVSEKSPDHHFVSKAKVVPDVWENAETGFKAEDFPESVSSPKAEYEAKIQSPPATSYAHDNAYFSDAEEPHWHDSAAGAVRSAPDEVKEDYKALENKVGALQISTATADSLLSGLDLDALEKKSFAVPAKSHSTPLETKHSEFDPFSAGSSSTANFMKRSTQSPTGVFGSEVAEALKNTSTHSNDLSAVFVVRFNTIKGNMIEFQHPKDVSLAGIEFTTLPSGSHSIGTDVIYFRRPPYYGLSVFKRTVVLTDTGANADTPTSRGKSEQIAREERGARVRSIGIMTKSFHELHWHVKFLQQQVEMHIFADIDTLSQSLMAYYHIVNDGGSVPVMMPLMQPSEVAVENPLAYLPQFVHKYGPSVFALWKMALLKQRLLFFSSPPVQESCLDVYCSSLLTNHDVPYFQQRGFESLFYVNINDMTLLERFKVRPSREQPFDLANSGYVACTSDALFKMKIELWDGLIYDGKLKLPPDVAPDRTSSMRFGVDSARRYGAYRVNAADESKYAFLKTLISKHTARADSTISGAKGGISGWISNLRGSVKHESVARRIQKEEETSSLLMDTDDVDEKWNFSSRKNQPTLSPIESDLASGAQESVTYRASLAILSYFHHLTTKLLSTVLMLCHSPGEAVLYSWDLYNLDLDPYSGGDRQFLLDLAALYKLQIRIPLLDEERQLIEEGRLNDGWENVGNEDHGFGKAATATSNGIRGTKSGGIYGRGAAGRWVGRNMTVMMREWEGFVGPQGLGIGAPGLGIGAIGLAAMGSVINALKPAAPP